MPPIRSRRTTCRRLSPTWRPCDDARNEHRARPRTSGAVDRAMRCDRSSSEPGRADGPASAGSRSSTTGRSACRYIVTAFVFFILAGVLAVLMRIQLAVPDRPLSRPDRLQPVLHRRTARR